MLCQFEKRFFLNWFNSGTTFGLFSIQIAQISANNTFSMLTLRFKKKLI